MGPSFSFAKAVTPDNSADNIGTGDHCRAIVVTVAGTVTWLDSAGGSNIIQCAVGVVYYIRTKRITATGTSATGIYAMW